MRKFIAKTSLFLFLFLLPLLALEFLLRRPSADSYALKHHLINSTLPDNEILILGNSLSWTGLNPAIIHERCINVANFNQVFYSDYKILETYLSKSPKLKVVILPLSLETFFSLSTPRADQLYHLYWGFEPISGKKTLEFYSAVVAFGFWNGIKKLIEEDNLLTAKGWGAESRVYDGSEQTARSKLREYYDLMKEENFTTCTDYLNRIVQLCEANRLRLILFLPPFSPAFNKILKNEPHQKKMLAFVKDFCRGKSLECYDFNDNNDFPNEYFRDCNHLNIKGAEKLSLLFREILGRFSQTVQAKWTCCKYED